jgi:hypothetical protein
MSRGGARPGAGRKAKEFTTEQRTMIEALAGYGLGVREISAVVGTTDKTLSAHCSEELERGRAKANARVAQSLFERATKDKDTTAMIWWTKARMKWTDRTEVEHTGPGGGPIQVVSGIDRG